MEDITLELLTEEIDIEDGQKLLAAILERAIRDLSILPPDSEEFKESFELIFTPDHEIYYDELDANGEQLPDGVSLNLQECLQLIGGEIDEEYLRWRTKKRLFEERRTVAEKLFGPLWEQEGILI